MYDYVNLWLFLFQPHFRSVIFCLTNPHAKGTKSTFVTEVKCSQSAFVDFFSDGQYDLILKEHKKFELNEFVKMTDGVNTKWVNELPDLQADLEAFVAVKFQVTWQKYDKYLSHLLNFHDQFWL